MTLFIGVSIDSQRHLPLEGSWLPRAMRWSQIDFGRTKKSRDNSSYN
jgi:hypothetical protein